MHFISKNEKETLAFAEKFAKKLKGGEMIGLTGDLGAGKTVFVKGLAKGLGIKENIQSPTFLLMKVYKINLRSKMSDVRSLVHIDAYRLSRGEELTDIGVMDWLGKKDTVTVIEWIENVPGIFNENKIIKIKIDFGEEKEGRILEIK
ncbi:tRNA (adenosine(37)-N6)-threonylcarbamoyltransferase complex ATPase subunit type 1 TsaE [Candidatus Falkowbacteria bacterium RIFOXYB2_FULL_38_15]|uniref:tRNA threonylcarbamoyladenosine biosynthesis protein TsaE n=1 Tax=Candidatus Falkowbacteria bacterium RIFOXYA2_FULL_38_12 TaxID=1797993 RepID=A0A1F5S4R6_9BACT|nr:MAG: tRNA (adenosine(37)-N6)-threonylcarbamoyltransferase complex ATPase subunit type 1 TsaE [Candidatus Falkowbacteria bacterium RIFOXYA2_FULL_38_12]OGF33712.1 MAG: tRNA (adenosine(37)-N6)-threonylcarbamoyltransferase complex ATPase subunit type 1 TsaE [Candidatus Falkowbacteria bacterium RIFOXYB2_FULL_38_15]OGF42285.1 MAG: tRNA (adenosine(37)-N6)-threonylcarbamoyltransferase complex ATPase subunit type 1 TsaE [Candidatus Falkowbacteria bacterium RIFOXYD2_FULL_39_16]